MAKDPHQFVKETGRDKQQNQQEKELQALLDSETGEIRSDLTAPVACAVCESKRHNLSFKKQGFRFVKCCDCGLIYVNPQLQESLLIDSYEHGQSNDIWVDVLLSQRQIEYDTHQRFGEAIRRLEKRYPKKKRGKVMDIGCSIGLFLKLMADRGWQPYGLEINEKASKHATEVYKVPVEPKLLHEVDYPENYFQIMSLWGVLEHVSNPAKVLGDIHPLLHPDGTLVILVPNVNSLATRIMHEVSPTFGGRNHLWYFSPETIAQLLDRKGFKVDQIYTQLPQFEELLHFVRFNNPYRAGEKVNKEEFNIQKSLQSKIEKYLLKNNMGYKLIVFASKKK